MSCWLLLVKRVFLVQFTFSSREYKMSPLLPFSLFTLALAVVWLVVTCSFYWLSTCLTDSGPNFERQKEERQTHTHFLHFQSVSSPSFRVPATLHHLTCQRPLRCVKAHYLQKPFSTFDTDLKGDSNLRTLRSHECIYSTCPSYPLYP